MGPKPNWLVFLEEEERTERQRRERRPCGHRVMLPHRKNTWNFQKLYEEERILPHGRPSEGSGPCQHLDFRL